MVAMATVPAGLMTSALAMTELTVNQLGHSQIAPEELALSKYLHIQFINLYTSDEVNAR